jgi:hypothetical protein
MFCSSALLLCTCPVSSNNSIAHKGITEIVLQERFEDINGVIRAVNRRREANKIGIFHCHISIISQDICNKISDFALS